MSIKFMDGLLRSIIETGHGTYHINIWLFKPLTFINFLDSNFVLGNAAAPPLYPIVYCSDGFCELAGLHRADIMQQPAACSFLWGPGTETDHK